MKNTQGIRLNSDGLPNVVMKGVIPRDTTLHGEMHFSGGLWIDGNVRGDLKGTPGEDPVLVINQDASVKGHLVADHIAIHGTVSGSIEARETLFLGPTARVRGGQIRYGEVIIAEGASITGQLLCNALTPAQEVPQPQVNKVRSTG